MYVEDGMQIEIWVGMVDYRVGMIEYGVGWDMGSVPGKRYHRLFPKIWCARCTGLRILAAKVDLSIIMAFSSTGKRILVTAEHLLMGSSILFLTNSIFTRGIHGVLYDIMKFFRGLPFMNHFISMVLRNEVKVEKFQFALTFMAVASTTMIMNIYLLHPQSSYFSL